MKRHSSLLLIMFFISGLIFTGCGKTQTEDKVLYLYNWTYYTPDDILASFKKETGITVIVDNFASNEEMFAKVQAGGAKGYDLIVPSQDYVSIMIKLGMLHEMDHNKIPNLKYIRPEINKMAAYDPQMQYSVPYFAGGSGIAVNKAKVTDYARDWSIFSDTRYKGKMSMLDDMREVMGAALKHLGYSANTTDDEQLEEAADLIITKWKPNLVKFDSESFGKSFANGEFDIVHCYAENVFQEVPEDEWGNIDFFVPQEGGVSYIDNFVIPKDAKHVDYAYQFINYFCSPKVYARFLDAFNYPSTVNTDAGKYQTTTPYFKPEDIVNSELYVDLGENLDKYNTIWQKIRYEQ
ncbi:MAG: extracellular solute-binding protein [Sphaerochaetaceae bacterium]